MGVSGSAGGRHVHVTVTRPAPGDDVAMILRTPGWKGADPVRFRLRTATASTFSDALPCDDDRARATVFTR
jgi:hypothetical protein